MPYPRAHLYFSAVLALAFLGFMPSYFLNLGAASPAHHFHATVATAWLLMLIGQSWAISHRKFALHRASGKGSYILAPLFVAAGVGVIHAMHNGAGPFREMFSGGLAFADAVAVVLFAGLYYSAIANRRDVQRHARCMSATVLLLISPIVARVLSFYTPGFTISGVEELQWFPVNFHLGNLAALLPALVLLYRDRGILGLRSPYLIVALAIGLQSLGFELVGDAAWWQALMSAFAAVPAPMVVASGLVAGAVLALAATRAAVSAAPPKPA